MSKDIRVRFAPSPTGNLHVGGARTALFNYLFARHNGGVFILRIEDTDQKRFQEDALEEIYKSLEWLGLNWDEGPRIGGNYGPYIQSGREGLYREFAHKLLIMKKAYRCFCSQERLSKLREQQEKEKMIHGLGYDTHCRNLTSQEIENNLEKGSQFVVRLKIPEKRVIIFEDLIRGKIEYQSDVLDDFVLLKSDGFPTYHLANVVDDHLMKISHVLRGDEWISSTPRHILTYEAFGWQLPKFAHMPVILAQGGGKLSKRKGAASVTDYKNLGYLPEALFNFLALLGWAPGDDREIMSTTDIIAAFTLERISPKPAVFDETKLEWMNICYLREKNTDSIIDKVIEIWIKKGFIDVVNDKDFKNFKKIVELFKDRAKKINDIAEQSVYFFRDPVEYESKAVKKYFNCDSINILKTLKDKINITETFEHNNLENIYREYAAISGISPGGLIHATRLAVSGISFGPGLFEIMEALGKETVLRRIENAIKWIESKI